MAARSIGTLRRRGFPTYPVVGYRGGRITLKGRYGQIHFTVELERVRADGRRFVPRERNGLDKHQQDAQTRLLEDWARHG